MESENREKTMANGDSDMTIRKRFVSKDKPAQTVETGDSTINSTKAKNKVLQETTDNDWLEANELSSLFPPPQTGIDVEDRGDEYVAADNSDVACGSEHEQDEKGDTSSTICDRIWGRVQSWMSTEAAPGRKTGFYRIHPATAKRLYCEILIGEDKVPSEQRDSTEPCGDSSDQRDVTIEKLFVHSCAFAIFVFYPVVLYLAFFSK